MLLSLTALFTRLGHQGVIIDSNNEAISYDLGSAVTTVFAFGALLSTHGLPLGHAVRFSSSHSVEL